VTDTVTFIRSLLRVTLYLLRTISGETMVDSRPIFMSGECFLCFCFHFCCTTHPPSSDDDIGTVAFMLFVDLVQRREIARRICETPCCSRRGGCLRALSDASAQETVMGCLDEMRGLTKLQKHEAIFQKILDCQYNLGVGLHCKAFDVCHQCFENAYELGPSQLYKIRGEVKRGKFCCLSCVS
jgi:hypothetical protein